MEYIYVVISGLALFFIVMSNYKVSRVEENQKCHEENIKKLIDLVNSVEENQKMLSQKIDGLVELPVNDTANKSNVNMGNFKNELISIDRKISNLHSLVGKIKTNPEKAVNSNVNKQDSKKTNFDVPQKKQTNKSEMSNDKKNIPAEDENVDVDSEILFNRFIIKYNQITEDERFVINRILKNSPATWERIEIDFMQEKTLRFILPLLCRKFILDGVPLIKMKEIGGGFKVIWGESFHENFLKRIVEYFKDVIK